MTPTDASELLAVALATAARRWPVFPLRPGAKRPALHGVTRCPRTGSCAGGHQGWEQRATTDPARIRRAWTAGAFNVGLTCGPAGLVVVDLDTVDPTDPADVVPPRWAALGATGGADVLAALAEQAGEAMPATYTVATPSGGQHLYFLAPSGAMLRNTSGEHGRGLGWKIDTRAHGGYVVAAGSATPDGVYRVVDDHPPVPLPGWLVQRLQPSPPPAPDGSVRTGAGRLGRYLYAAITAETARVHTAPAGERNRSLYIAAHALGQLVAGGSLAEHDARTALLSAAAGHVALGAYNAHQAEQTITSGLRAGAKRPRTITDPTGAAA